MAVLAAQSTAHGEVTYSERFEPAGFYRYILKPAARAIGLPTLRFHDLRHTFASLSSATGIPVEVVSEWMGHSSFVVTWTIYTHLFAQDRDGWADRLTAPAPHPTHSAPSHTVTPLRPA